MRTLIAILCIKYLRWYNAKYLNKYGTRQLKRIHHQICKKLN